jgi:hypothetical protein
VAWEGARDRCPEHADSAEFRDGFIDGYVDYLDRGGNGSLRPVPVAKYTRHRKYFTEDGQCLAKEYLLGFKMGQDVAISSGQRRLLTVPVLLPQEPTGPVPFNVQPAANDAPLPMIPPQPPGNVAQSSAANRIPSPAPAPVSAMLPPQTAHPPLLRLAAKTAPPDDFQPIAKPLPVAEPVGKAAPPPEFHPISQPGPEPHGMVPLPLPLPADHGPSGPRTWGDLPAIPPMTPTTHTAEPMVPHQEEPTPRVLPPNHSLRLPLPPNHPLPRE